MAESLAHRVRRMGGRDPHEQGRSATPLELLFAHGVAAVTWAWIQYSGFASA